jgi:hypothetical protein
MVNSPKEDSDEDHRAGWQRVLLMANRVASFEPGR